MQITLGVVPDALVLNLSYGSPFIASLQRSDATNWPAGTVIELRIGTAPAMVIWLATINGTNASWNQSVAAVNAVAHAGVVQLFMDGVLWASGSVVRNA